MFAEYVPFTIKYLYHILIVVVSFILFKKFFGRPTERTEQSGMRAFTASDESTDPSESNVAADTFTCEMLERDCQSYLFYFEKKRERTAKILL